jgi:hypothetical protein
VESLKKSVSTLKLEKEKLSKQYSALEVTANKSYTKIIHPDGKIEIHKLTTTQTKLKEEIENQVTQKLESKHKEELIVQASAHEIRLIDIETQKNMEIKSLEDRLSKVLREKEEIVNPRNFTFEVGYTSSATPYIHATMPLVGPFIIGLHSNIGFFSGNSTNVGAGIGLRF